MRNEKLRDSIRGIVRTIDELQQCIEKAEKLHRLDLELYEKSLQIITNHLSVKNLTNLIDDASNLTSNTQFLIDLTAQQRQLFDELCQRIINLGDENE